MEDAFYAMTWRQEVNKVILSCQNDGVPLVLMDWTTFLVNGKAVWRKDLKKSQNTISSTSSGPHGGSNSSRGNSDSGGDKKDWNTTTGKPTASTIHCVDIAVLYGNLTKIAVEPFASLPRITR